MRKAYYAHELSDESIKAIKEARCGELPSFDTVEELMDDLNTEDETHNLKPIT